MTRRADRDRFSKESQDLQAQGKFTELGGGELTRFL
jgi:hypothetical protein